MGGSSNENMIIQGDALSVLKTFADESVDCCVTSPPYYNLRDYGCEGQIGLEKTPEEYIQKLVEIFREVRRVLKKDGTLWVNIADSYAGSGKGASNYPENAKKHKQGTNKGSCGSYLQKTVSSDCKSKDLIGIPWMLAFALRADGWYLRQDIIWAKPNPMPESVKDRCTKSHEYIFMLSKTPRYYFDDAAIAEPSKESTIKRPSQNIENQNGSYLPGKTNGKMKAVAPRYGGNAYDYRPKRKKRDVWTVTTKPFKGAHFATFPPDLIEPCILAGCPAGGVVLDPFAGSGTTGMVAKRHGRAFALIELNNDYIKMCEERTDCVGSKFMKGGVE